MARKHKSRSATKHRSLYKRRFFAILVLFAVAIWTYSFLLKPSDRVQAQTTIPGPYGVGGSWKLIFNDEFDGAALDTTKWVPCFPWGTAGGCQSTTTPNATYRPDNVIIENGIARLRSQKGTFTGTDGKTYPYSSGMITTAEYNYPSTGPKFSAQYGYYEARIKVPKGQGLWPAFWLLPATNAWPPEIDIMENLTGNGLTTFDHHMHFHYNDANGVHQDNGAGWTSPADLSSDFHVYAVSWEPGHIKWLVDGVERRTAFTDSAWIPHEKMYILLNLQVGGTWPGDPDGTTPFPNYYDIDYVRVWQWDSTITPTTAATTAPTATPVPTNQIINPSFEQTGSDWLTPWSFSVKPGAAAAISRVTSTKAQGKASARINITQASSNWWYVQLSQGISLIAGRTYTVSFWARASSSRTIRSTVQKGPSPYTEYSNQAHNITTAWKQYTYTFVQPATDSSANLHLNFANNTGTVWVDNVSLK